MRLRRPLTHGWQLAPDLEGPPTVDPDDPNPPRDGWGPVVVPGLWQLQDHELARATGAVWYRTSFHLAEHWLDRERLVIDFGAVGHFAQGWLNGRYVGQHEGGHLPFSWGVSDAVLAGENELVVRVVSPSGEIDRYPDFPFEETLHGKQSWYGPNGGIWQEVAIEATSQHAIVALSVEPDPGGASVDVAADLNQGGPGVSIGVEVFSPDSELVGAASDAAPGTTVGVAIDSVQLWSIDAPHLYTLRATVRVDGAAVDVVERRFGFRTFSTDGGRFVLNGEPVMLRGVLDQDYYDSPGVPASKEDLLERFRVVKEMGFNTLRCHVKIPDPWYLDAADELGLLVWSELPMASRLTTPARERIERTLAGIVERDRHHPSVVIWGIANESWGFDLVGNPEHRSWLHELYRSMKSSVSDRLIVDNSPCRPNFHIETDVEDYHFYAVIPEMRRQWDRFVDDFSRRAEFTFSANGDARRTGDEPLVVSEFGVWGLPDLTELSIDTEPWWFETGQEWGGGAAYVHGAEDRFALWHLDRVFGDWAGLCSETQRRQYETMRYQIDSLRVRPQIAGYVVTELSDVHWEANGMLDMAGRPRSFASRLPELNASTSLIARYVRPAIWDDEAIELGLTLVNGPVSRSGSELTWRLSTGRASSIPVGQVGSHEIRALDTVEIDVEPVEAPTIATVTCAMADADGSIAETEHSVVVIPRREAITGEPMAVATRDPDLADYVEALGHTAVEPGELDGLRLVRRLDDDDHRFVRAGGRILLLPEDSRAFGRGFFEFPRIELARWQDALTGGGEWISAFSWLRRSGRFGDLPGGPMMDLTFDGLAPDLVITGIPPARFEYAVFAGVFVGWVHQVAGLIARHDVGYGSVLICTLKLTERPPGEDPIATWLLHQLIATVQE